MPNGDKKILRCLGCNVAYNITNLKPGSKFKCQKCGTINVVPAETGVTPPVPVTSSSAPSKPPTSVASSAPPSQVKQKVTSIPAQVKKPTTPPASSESETEVSSPRPSKIAIGTKPTSASRISAVSKPGKFSGKTSSKFKKPASVQGAEGEMGEEEGFEVQPKNKKKLFLIGGIVLVVVIIVVLIIVLGGKKGKSAKDTGKKETKVTTEEKTNEVTKPPEPKKEEPTPKTEWEKVDSTVKDQVKDILQRLKDAPNSFEAAKLKKELVNTGWNGLAALIELYFDDTKTYKNIPTWMKSFTLKEPGTKQGVAMRKLMSSDELMAWYQKFWLNKELLAPGWTYPPADVLKNLDEEIKRFEAEITAGGSLQLRDEFKPLIKEDFRTRIQKILKQWNDDEISKDDAVAKLNEIGKQEVVPVLITEIANDDGFIGLKASLALKKITGWMQSKEYNGEMNKPERFDICLEWQDWWLENKDK